MARREEEIIVKLGGDSKALLKDLNMSRQAVNAWGREIAKDIKDGHIPQAWKNVSETVRRFNAKTGEQTHTSWKKWGGETGNEIAKIGKAFVAAFAVREVIASLKDVSAELDALYANIDAKAYQKAVRDKQLAGISRPDQEGILAGQSQVDTAVGGFKNWMAKAAGLYAFAAGTVSRNIKDTLATSDPGRLLFGWGEASQKAAAAQSQIVEGMRIAAQQAAIDEDAKKKLVENEKKQQQILKDRQELMKEFARHDAESHRTALADLKRQTEELQKQAAVIAATAAKRHDLKRNLGQSLQDEFSPTLEELSTTGIYTQEASRALWLQQDIKDAMLWGDKKGQVDDMLELQGIREKLSKAGVYKDPNQGIIDELKRLTDPATVGAGLKVQIKTL